jgi:hypothetical protein
LKHECHLKTIVGLKVFSKSIPKHFRGFSSGFTELHTKLDADTFDFAIHRRQKETQGQKSARVKAMRIHSMVSHSRLMQ